ncbi:MAG: ATP-binding protein [Candidatus Kapabacteria bacterium]|nr:ATP-binding protein [Candidatus Kapabacteria bacterium]
MSKNSNIETKILKDSKVNMQKEYIHTLEMSVVLLQKEIENLRAQLNLKENKESQPIHLKTNTDYSKLVTKFNNCKSNEELLEVVFNKIGKSYSLLEINLYFYNYQKTIEPISINTGYSTLNNLVMRFEEQGILDWVSNEKIVSIIHNLDDEFENTPTFIVLVPILAKENVIGFLIGRTSKDKDLFNETELNELSLIAEYAAYATDNLRGKVEIEKMNHKLSGLSHQMLETSRMATIGELTTSISKEFENPLKIIKGNLDLIDKGVGNQTRRLDIIKEQIEKMMQVQSKILSISTVDFEEIEEKLNICTVIDNILMISESQFVEEDIKVIKNYSNKNFEILFVKSQFEQVVLNLLFNSKERFVDGGEITISVFDHRKNSLIFSITDNSIGYSDDELNNIFEPDFSTNFGNKAGLGLYLAKSIVTKYKGKINVVSDLNKGTTYRIILPKI